MEAERERQETERRLKKEMNEKKAKQEAERMYKVRYCHGSISNKYTLD